MVQYAQNQSSPAPMPFSFPPQEPPQPPRQGRSREASSRTAVIVGLVVVALLVAVGGYWLWSSGHEDAANAAVGDCLDMAGGGAGSAYRIVDCADTAASHKVLATVPGSTDAKKCREVAGASRSITSVDGSLCIAKKDVDPAKAINVAKQGECVQIEAGVAERVNCSDPQAGYRILKRFQDVADFQLADACEGVRDSRRQYEWAWDSENQSSNAPKLMIDLVFCLGEV